MGYTERLLSSNERIVFRGTVHWIFLAKTILTMCLCFIPGTFIFFKALEIGEEVGVLIAFGFVLYLIFLIDVCLAVLDWKTTEAVVTTKRVIWKTGIVRKKTFEILLPKVEGAAYHQGIIARMFGYGNIAVSGSGGSKNMFGRLTNAIEFKKHIQDQIDMLSGTPTQYVAQHQNIAPSSHQGGFCRNCGTAFSADSQFCGGCGTKRV